MNVINSLEKEPSFVKETLNYFNLVQKQGECYEDFRKRAISFLKQENRIVEAYEVEFRQRYEDCGGNAYSAILGHVGLLLNEKHPKTGGDSLAAGTVLQNPKPEMSAEEAILSMMFFGGK